MAQRFFAISLVVCQLGLPSTSLAKNNGALASARPAPEVRPAGRKPLHWRCWYDQEVHIHCLLESAPAESRSARKPLSPRPPAFTQAIYAKPEIFRGALVSIPLLTPPMDMELVAVLADAATCGVRDDCSVNFTEELPAQAEIEAVLGRPLDNDSPAIMAALAGAPDPGIAARYPLAAALLGVE